MQENSKHYFLSKYVKDITEQLQAGNHVEHRKGVNDETELLVGQKGVQQNEAYVTMSSFLVCLSSRPILCCQELEGEESRSTKEKGKFEAQNKSRKDAKFFTGDRIMKECIFL